MNRPTEISFKQCRSTSQTTLKVRGKLKLPQAQGYHPKDELNHLDGSVEITICCADDNVPSGKVTELKTHSRRVRENSLCGSFRYDVVTCHTNMPHFLTVYMEGNWAHFHSTLYYKIQKCIAYYTYIVKSRKQNAAVNHCIYKQVFMH